MRFVLSTVGTSILTNLISYRLSISASIYTSGTTQPSGMGSIAFSFRQSFECPFPLEGN